jgi:hypothetical protein
VVKNVAVTILELRLRCNSSCCLACDSEMETEDHLACHGRQLPTQTNRRTTTTAPRQQHTHLHHTAHPARGITSIPLLGIFLRKPSLSQQVNLPSIRPQRRNTTPILQIFPPPFFFPVELLLQHSRVILLAVNPSNIRESSLLILIFGLELEIPWFLVTHTPNDASCPRFHQRPRTCPPSVSGHTLLIRPRVGGMQVAFQLRQLPIPLVVEAAVMA